MLDRVASNNQHSKAWKELYTLFPIASAHPACLPYNKSKFPLLWADSLDHSYVAYHAGPFWSRFFSVVALSAPGRLNRTSPYHST